METSQIVTKITVWEARKGVENIAKQVDHASAQPWYVQYEYDFVAWRFWAKQQTPRGESIPHKCSYQSAFKQV